MDEENRVINQELDNEIKEELAAETVPDAEVIDVEEPAVTGPAQMSQPQMSQPQMPDPRAAVSGRKGVSRGKTFVLMCLDSFCPSLECQF